jgi:hypothetical protein
MAVNVPARSFSRPYRNLSICIHTYKVEKNLAGYPINNKLLNNRTPVISSYSNQWNVNMRSESVTDLSSK